MACPALAKEDVFAIGFKQQADLVTPQAVADMVNLQWDEGDPVRPQFVREDDSDDNTGNQNDFATQTFPVSKHIEFRRGGFLSVEKMAIAAAMCLGTAAKTGAGPSYEYTSVPMARETDGCELPAFSILHQIRAGAGTLPDNRYVSNAMVGFEVDLLSAPGRASSRITCDFMGFGVRNPDSDSGLTMPTRYAENLLQSASLTLSVLGNDLVTLRRINSLKWGFRAPISRERMFFPGSGVDSNNFALGGRLEFGKREPVLEFNVDMDEVGEEEIDYLAGNEGTAVISQSAGVGLDYTATFHRIQLLDVRQVRNGQNLAWQVIARPLWHASNGLLDVVTNVTFNNIFAVSS